MSTIKIKRRHRLGRAKARERVQEVANSLQDKLNAKWSWQGDSLSFQRSGASGSVDVGEDYVEFNIKLSMLLTPMKGSIEQAIENEIDQALS